MAAVTDFELKVLRAEGQPTVHVVYATIDGVRYWAVLPREYAEDQPLAEVYLRDVVAENYKLSGNSTP